MTKLLWWGYRHINGSLHLKRYFDNGDISEAINSPFVQEISGAFSAKNSDEANQILKKKFK